MTLSNTALCHYAECRILFTILLNVIILSDVMLNAVMLSVILLSVMASYKFTYVKRCIVEALGECRQQSYPKDGNKAR